MQKTRFCIFIDGLDEYDGESDELVEIVRYLADTEDVKLCVASRPWNAFEAAFGGARNQMRKLHLQDLNKSDIEKYVRAKIEKRDDFQGLKAREPGADELIQEITTKSRGVFLWVYLVVRSLIQGLQNADRIVDLQRRLRAFPSDLNEFFNHIFLSLDMVYRVQTAARFRLRSAPPDRCHSSTTTIWTWKRQTRTLRTACPYGPFAMLNLEIFWVRRGSV
jgi:hypothetical protein